MTYKYRVRLWNALGLINEYHFNDGKKALKKAEAWQKISGVQAQIEIGEFCVGN